MRKSSVCFVIPCILPPLAFVQPGKDGDIVDINDVGYLFHQDEDTLQLVMTFASLDRIHSAVIHNMEWKITFWW